MVEIIMYLNQIILTNIQQIQTELLIQLIGH